MKHVIFIVIIVVVTAITFFGCYTNKFGSYHLDEKISFIEKDIKREGLELTKLKKELDSNSNNYKNNLEEINDKQDRISKLQQRYNDIIDQYLKEEGVPQEITSYEADYRTLANNLRRQDLVLKKIEKNLATGDNFKNTNELQEDGLQVIIANNYFNDVTFSVFSGNGGEKISVCLAPKTQQNIFLIGGKYVVYTYSGGRQLGEGRYLNIDGSKHYYKGQSCFGFVYMPEY